MSILAQQIKQEASLTQHNQLVVGSYQSVTQRKLSIVSASESLHKQNHLLAAMTDSEWQQWSLHF